MKIECKFLAQVLDVSSSVNEKDGKTYYKAVLFLSSAETKEAGTLNIPENVAKNIIVGEKYYFIGCWNDKYQSFYITGVCDE